MSTGRVGVHGVDVGAQYEDLAQRALSDVRRNQRRTTVLMNYRLIDYCER